MKRNELYGSCHGTSCPNAKPQIDLLPKENNIPAVDDLLNFEDDTVMDEDSDVSPDDGDNNSEYE